MTQFESDFFRKVKLTKSQIGGYLKNAYRDLTIAGRDSFVEVRFTYAYQALIKGGIALIATVGHVKVRAVPGHHIKILESVSEILRDPDIFTLGNAMRMKRNEGLYGDAGRVTETEAAEYLIFVKSVLGKIKERVGQTAKRKAVQEIQ